MKFKSMSVEQLMVLLEKREERIGNDQEVVNSIEGELLRRRLDALKKVDDVVVRDLLASGYSHLGGDAGKSASDWFCCLTRDVVGSRAMGIRQFVILCPQFLRGPLRLQVNFVNGEVRMSNSY